jgi:hypothetical protein
VDEEKRDDSMVFDAADCSGSQENNALEGSAADRIGLALGDC